MATICQEAFLEDGISPSQMLKVLRLEDSTCFVFVPAVIKAKKFCNSRPLVIPFVFKPLLGGGGLIITGSNIFL